MLDVNVSNKLVEKLNVCNRVEAMMETDGWKTIVMPRIESLLAAVSGTHRSGELATLGTVALSTKTEDVWKNIGIKIGITQVYNMIIGHSKEKERIKKVLENSEKLDAMPDLGPMDNSRYNLER